MRPLTKTQQFVVDALMYRGAYAAAYDFEVKWRLGQTHKLDPKNGARRGLTKLIEKGNKEALS